ncbi:MAG: aldehyde dehydrogenase (NADP(+)) [Pseudomonadota bacterium]
MEISGQVLIGGVATPGKGKTFFATNPANGEQLAPAFEMADAAQVDAACRLAQAAFDPFRAMGDVRRADFLERIGVEIMAIGDTLVERVMAETGLPQARVVGERGRTIGQLKLFADLLREGSWTDARIDPALPERQPLPRPDLRLRRIGLGPVVVFAASNFPLAFSAAGGDTASAFAAGCPVILKAHSAHPGTSALVGAAIARAAAACELPAGVFSLLFGGGSDIGTALVAHPAIKAVGFTGSRQGGQALMAVAAARKEPIPVYAEMSSVNPVFMLPHALSARADALAEGFAASLTQGVGQFCTNPGMVVGLAGPDFERFAGAAAKALGGAPCATMLTAGIAASYQRGIEQIAGEPAVSTLMHAVQQCGKGAPALFQTSADDWMGNPALHQEVFGPAALLVACRDADQMHELAELLEGQLTVTLQMDDADLALAARLLPILERKAGRILANGFPTGVEVAGAMVHGGPFPATSDGRSSSVGTAAIDRFLRPVSYQNLPAALLPQALKPGNPSEIWRRTEGRIGRE